MFNVKVTVGSWYLSSTLQAELFFFFVEIPVFPGWIHYCILIDPTVSEKSNNYWVEVGKWYFGFYRAECLYMGGW